MRSGNVSYGETLIEDIRKNKVFTVIISTDMGETSKKKIVDKCTFYQIPYFTILDKVNIKQKHKDTIIEVLSMNNHLEEAQRLFIWHGLNMKELMEKYR